jgi:hypothetical protein
LFQAHGKKDDFMTTRVLIGIWTAALMVAAQASAEQGTEGSQTSADEHMPATIGCAQERGEALGQCSYQIKSDEIGTTTVTVIFASGFKRRLFFSEGKFVKASVTMSGVGTDVDWSLKDAIHKIRVEDQRYEVPESLITSD